MLINATETAAAGLTSDNVATWSVPAPLTLRDYQVADIEALRDAYRKGAKAPLYQLATGGGKTVVFSHIVQSSAAKGKRVLVLAHRRELVRQAQHNLTWSGVPHGIMAAGMDRDHDAPVIVASIQTVARRLDKLPQFDLIVADEAHHAREQDLERAAGQPAEGQAAGRYRDAAAAGRQRPGHALRRAVRRARAVAPRPRIWSMPVTSRSCGFTCQPPRST